MEITLSQALEERSSVNVQLIPGEEEELLDIDEEVFSKVEELSTIISLETKDLSKVIDKV